VNGGVRGEGFGAIIGGGLFFLASSVLALHARRHGDRWHSRVPVVWLESLNTGAWEAKLFQVVILVIFIALPAAAIVRCMGEAESGDICEQDAKHFYKGSETTLLWPPVAKEGHQMRLRKAGAGEEPCLSGVELFPRSWTPGSPTDADYFIRRRAAASTCTHHCSIREIHPSRNSSSEIRWNPAGTGLSGSARRGASFTPPSGMIGRNARFQSISKASR